MPKRILLIELFEMGAAIMLVPSIRFLMRERPDAELHVLTSSTCHSVWAAIGLIPSDRIHVVQSRSAFDFVWSLMSQVFNLRRQAFDSVIDFELFMRISAITSGLIKSDERAGFHRFEMEGLYRGRFFVHEVAFNQNSHIARNYLALTKTALLGKGDTPNFKGAVPREEVFFPADYPPATEDELRQILPSWSPSMRYMAICPDVGKNLSMRNYPAERFSRVIDELATSHPEIVPVLIGTRSDHGTAETVRLGSSDPARIINLCGQTSLDQLFKVLSRAELLLTNDNGPSHFAALTGTKVVALFSMESPYMYGPLGKAVTVYSYFQCSPCVSAYNHKRSRCTNNLCLQAISPEKVAGIVRSVLDGNLAFNTVNLAETYLP